MNLKQAAARRALEFVQDGMILGLGTGSTTSLFVHLLGERIVAGDFPSILAVPTSEATAELARHYNMPLTSLSEHPRLDLAIDGADEVDPQLNLIKGLGKALLREKIVAIHAERFIVIVDESKLVSTLGEHVPLPVEIVPWEAKAHVHWLNTLGCEAQLWMSEGGSPVITDNGNCLARCWFPVGIDDPKALAAQLAERPGIVEHGLFLEMASQVIVAGAEGVRLLPLARSYSSGRIR